MMFACQLRIQTATAGAVASDYFDSVGAASIHYWRQTAKLETEDKRHFCHVLCLLPSNNNLKTCHT